MTAPFIDVTHHSVPYSADPTSVFASLCGQKPYTLLLESAEIQSKNSLKSLLIASSCLTVSCRGQAVYFRPLNANGAALLPLIQTCLADKATVRTERDGSLVCEFSPLHANVDEETKLHAATVFDGLRTLVSLFSHAETPILLGGLFAYDLVANFIPMENIELQDDGLDCPDYQFYLADQLLVLDHQSRQASLQAFCFAPSYAEPLAEQSRQILADLQKMAPNLPLVAPNSTDIQTNLDDDAFKSILNSLKTHLYQGDVFQIVPSRRFSLACLNRLASYHRLKQTNPSPYMFYMQDEAFTLFGASPESALKFNAENREVEVYPIAGSRPRGFNDNGQIDPELDARLELELRLDHKEQSEHLMLVDLARNDIASVCEAGSRHVKALMQVDRYSHIMHLVSRVAGTLRPELDALHAYQACMNMGTLTGAPKIKAMQLIYHYEKQKRHSYGGAVGYLTSDGQFDTCIVIRSAFVQNNVAYVQAGCGEVLDSDLQAEADETRHKARAVLNAISYINQQAVV